MIWIQSNHYMYDKFTLTEIFLNAHLLFVLEFEKLITFESILNIIWIVLWKDYNKCICILWLLKFLISRCVVLKTENAKPNHLNGNMTMKFIRMLVFTYLTVYVFTIQRRLNFIEHHFSKINIYCLQNFVNKGVAEQSHIQCAIECSSFYSPHCQPFLWNGIDETCMTIDNIVKRDVDVSMQLATFVPYKDGEYHL